MSYKRLGLVIAAFGYATMFLTVSGAVFVGIALFYRFDRGRSAELPPTTESATAPIPHL